MLSSSDLLHLPYTSDLTEGGIAYALRALSHNDMTYNRMRRMIAGVAVDLAFRRQLSQQNVPYETISAPPFTDHDRHDVLLGGQRCDVKSFFISNRDQISSMRRDPQLILNAPALVPSDIDAAEGHTVNDWYIFAFVTGLTATKEDEIKKVIAKKQPHYFVHILPERWRSPENWNPLGALVLSSEASEEIIVEISGQNQSREFITRLVHLPPRTRITVNDPFYALSAIHIQSVPAARMEISAPMYKSEYAIVPSEWQNIRVYGMDIIFTGFITRGEFRQRAHFIPTGSRVFQYARTRAKNLAVPVSSLKPLRDLFARASRA
jgi:hypothetical protein